MQNRYHDALMIQEGACNPSGVARALVKAIDETRAENANPRTDAACRLIAHQLAFLLGVDEIDNGDSLLYGRLTEECKKGKARIEAEQAALRG